MADYKKYTTCKDNKASWAVKCNQNMLKWNIFYRYCVKIEQSGGNVVKSHYVNT